MGAAAKGNINVLQKSPPPFHRRQTGEFKVFMEPRRGHLTAACPHKRPSVNELEVRTSHFYCLNSVFTDCNDLNHLRIITYHLKYKTYATRILFLKLGQLVLNTLVLIWDPVICQLPTEHFWVICSLAALLLWVSWTHRIATQSQRDKYKPQSYRRSLTKLHCNIY